MPAILNLTAQQIQRAREAIGDEYGLTDDATGQARIATQEELEQYAKAAIRGLVENNEERRAARARVRTPFGL